MAEYGEQVGNAGKNKGFSTLGKTQGRITGKLSGDNSQAYEIRRLQ